MTLQEIKQAQKAELTAAEGVIATAEQARRGMTADEDEKYTKHMDKYKELTALARNRESLNTVHKFFGKDGTPFTATVNAESGFSQFEAPIKGAFAASPENSGALLSYLRSGGKTISADLEAGADGIGGFRLPGADAFTRQRLANGSMRGMQASQYEGTDGAGNAGAFINIPTVQQVVPLAMPDLGIFDAAMVIPTSTDLKIPRQTAFGTSTLKAESTGTIATFGGNDATNEQFELRSWMAGALRLCSWELLQDVPVFQSFIAEDLIRSQRILEGQLFATGSGSGSSQPQGVFGNVGTGTGTAYQLTGTAATDAVTLINSLYDVVASLKAAYQPNASWVMARATALAIRKAQSQANLFNPVVTVDPDGTTRILGRPVFFDTNAPALPSATNAGVYPILYGDFNAGYLIGIRGGSGINIKLLDQPWANQGQLGILAYRRVDGVVRRSEAIQAIKVSHS
ncbi:MAG TPA: phage major capsid protein [Terracidiphilus sp.]|nr:phage major capsid protein [Terracidiphilus sp.]